MKIKGLPEGYDIVRIGRPEKGELFIGGTGMVAKSTGGEDAVCYLILRKIERPKQYRPFANAEEFKPHRNRWWKWNPVKFPPNRNCPPLVYDDHGHGAETWEQNFRDKVFDDGSPFGVEVSESDGPPITRPALAEPSHK
jgi:hypothetical protein